MRKEGNVALGWGKVASPPPPPPTQEQPHGVQALSSQRMGCLPVSRSKLAAHRLSAAYLASPSSDHEWLRGEGGGAGDWTVALVSAAIPVDCGRA